MSEKPWNSGKQEACRRGNRETYDLELDLVLHLHPYSLKTLGSTSQRVSSSPNLGLVLGDKQMGDFLGR